MFFEKEIEEKINILFSNDNFVLDKKGTLQFVLGIYHQYCDNKANEWHFVKDGDLPTKELEEKQLLIRVCNYTEDCIFAYYMLDKYYSKKGKRFYSDTDCDYPIDIEDIIAWCEIPKFEDKE